MELFATRGYFFCKYCGSFHFPDTVADEGVKVLGEGPEPLACVVCAEPLAAARLDDTHAVRYCRNCRGLLIARRGFASVVHTRRAWATDVPGPPVPLNRPELDRKVSCPKCRTVMTTHPYYGPGNVVIDSCIPCDLVWLDFGELKQIVAAPGKDRGTREVVPRASSDTLGDARLNARAAEPSDGDDLLALIFRLF